MSEVLKRYETDEAFREVANLLYGGGAEELISKISPEQSDLATKKRQKRQAQVGLASNVVGLAAGTAGTAAALRDPRLKSGGKITRKIYATGKKLPSPVSSKTGKAGAMLAGGALGLQVANIAGDAVANRVLARSAKAPTDSKKKPMIHKRLTPISKKEAEAAKVIEEIPEGGAFPRAAGALTLAVAPAGTDKVIAGTNKLAKYGKGKLKKLPAGPKGTKAQGKKELSKRDETFDVHWEGEISKLNVDKQQVFGWASIVEVNGEPVVDLQGDYIAIDEVEKSAYEYVHKSRKGGDMHLRDGDQPVHKSDMIESFVVTPEKKKALGLPDEMPVGWWVGYQINDPELWSKVKNGERTGFSIHGRGIRTPA